MKKHLENILYGIVTLATIALFLGFVISPGVEAYGTDVDGAGSSTTSSDVPNNTNTSSTTSSMDYSGSEDIGTMRMLGANQLSSISWTLSPPTTLLYSDGQTTYGGSPTYSGTISYTYTDSETKTAEKSVTGSEGEFTPEADSITSVKLTITSVKYADGSTATIDTATTTEEGPFHPNDSITFDLSGSKVTQNAFNWKTSGTPSITYSDYKPFTGTVAGYTGTISYKSGSSSVNMDVTNATSATFTTSDVVSDFKFVISSCKLSDGSTGTIKEGSPITGNLNGNTVDFSMTPLKITLSKAASPSTYENITKGEITDSGSTGISGSISVEDVGTILDTVYNSGNATLKNIIDMAMADGKKISIAAIAKSVSSVDENTVNSLKTKARSYDGAGDAENFNYFDISLYLSIGGKARTDLGAISSPGTTVNFTYKFPSGVIKKDSSSTSSSSSDGYKLTKTITKKRYYNVFRYHGGSAYDVGTQYTNNSSMTFGVSEFSTFGTYYYDDSSTSTSSSSYGNSSSSRGVSSSRSNPSTSRSSPGIGTPSTGTGASGNAAGSKAPKTGDAFEPGRWVYLIVIGVVVALCAFILFQDTKDNTEEKNESDE